MKRSLKELLEYQIETTDKKNAQAVNFLFDEKQWLIRYLKADFGNIFSFKEVLIPRAFLKKPIWDKKMFPVNMHSEDIEKCPKIEEKLPVSRQYEEKIHKHYGLNPYWLGVYSAPNIGMMYPPRPVKVPKSTDTASSEKSILRSFNEVKGYHIVAEDGKIGHIDDLIIDDSDWQIVYAVIDTSNWMPWSKKVLVAIDWLEKISFRENEVRIGLDVSTVEEAPAYADASGIDTRYEMELKEYYQLHTAQS